MAEYKVIFRQPYSISGVGSGEREEEVQVTADWVEVRDGAAVFYKQDAGGSVTVAVYSLRHMVRVTRQ